MAGKKAVSKIVLKVLLVLIAGMGILIARPLVGAKLARSADLPGGMDFGGLTRTYYVHVPPSYTGEAAYPLVVALHGRGGDGGSMPWISGLDAAADRSGYIVAYPDGYKKCWADGRGTTRAEKDGIDDVGFISALIDKLEKEYRIDQDRVFATGLSNGAFMSLRLACELSDRIAAAAPVAGSMGRDFAGRCQPAGPVSILIIHGTDDPVVPYQGGQQKLGYGGVILSSSETFEKWARLDSCAGKEEVTDLPDAADDGTRVRRRSFVSCREGSEVIQYEVEGGGHAWPGGAQYVPAFIIGRTSQDLDAASVILDFFSGHKRNPAAP